MAKTTDGLYIVGKLLDKNDQQKGNCFICSEPTIMMTRYCMHGTDTDEGESCLFQFKLCKSHKKNKRDKVLLEHFRDFHDAVDLT